MLGLPIPQRQYLPAVVLGLAAAAALSAPPLSPASRLDWAAFDALSRLTAPAAPQDIAVLEFDDPAWLGTLTSIAESDGARLLVTTHAQPPSPRPNEIVLGPTELPLGDRLLRRTQWQQGGHLWFRNEIDGLVRRDWTEIDDQMPIKSLTQAAAERLGKEAPGATDRAGRHWPIFSARDSFTRLEPRDLLAQPGLLQGKIVVAGASDERFETALGPMSAPELVAQMLAARLSGLSIVNTTWLHVATWLAAGVLAVALLCARASRLRRTLLAAIAGAGLAGAAAAAFLVGHLALPITAPVAFLLVTGGLAALRTLPALGAGKDMPGPVQARRLMAEGRLVAAAAAYRAIPSSAALLPELYDLANALESEREPEQAAALFHRIAQSDVHYRDVACRLAGRVQPRSHPGSGMDADMPTPLAGLPTTLGRYELLENLGQGTTGRVYLGRDPKINRLLAIKVMNPSGDGQSPSSCDTSEDLRREAQSAGRLNHPNIVTIYDVGDAQGLAYIAMEYLKGRHLSDFTDDATLLPAAKVIDLMAATADALHYAHQRHVVHRDIKPANIMYDSVLDELKITDFGIARLIDVSRTRTGIVLGTPSYMAPEQLEGENVNGHTDLFALGVTLYQLLTGCLPFRGASMTKLMFVIANEPHQPVSALRPGLPAALSSIIDKALAKKPSERFTTGAEMADALRAVSTSII
jgi:serine/threonine-protein kinase